MRQRPGKGNAIFLTLEDEHSVANIIFWERTFTRFRPIVMGARFIRVTGKLQSESGVIHIVAEKVEDLTPWLSALLEEAAGQPGSDPKSDPARPVNPDRSSPPATRNMPAGQDIATLSGKAESVMPKGRNFQ
ncbi:hypothetical protein AJ88_00700 [Mesorhizobium amorphae CCBAU 01583]|nr:hypothetical protein AJ88_00700 [Mesorhizobium amorphae CCBAU 01583]